MRAYRKLSLPCLLAGAALLLCSCGGSAKGLIPSASAGPLRQDFEAVAAAAEKGNGNCAPTRQAIATMERDYAELPRSIDVGLHERLSEGVENLTAKALAQCEQLHTSTTSTQVTETATTVTEPATSTSTTETEITPTEAVETETLSSSSAGGVEAPEEPLEGESPESGGTSTEAPAGPVEGAPVPEPPATHHGGVGAP